MSLLLANSKTQLKCEEKQVLEPARKMFVLHQMRFRGQWSQTTPSRPGCSLYCREWGLLICIVGRGSFIYRLLEGFSCTFHENESCQREWRLSWSLHIPQETLVLRPCGRRASSLRLAPASEHCGGEFNGSPARLGKGVGSPPSTHPGFCVLPADLYLCCSSDV